MRKNPRVCWDQLLSSLRCWGSVAVPKAGGGVEGALDRPLLPRCHIYLPHH